MDYNKFFLLVGFILFAFALAGEWKATTQIVKSSKDYTANTLLTDPIGNDQQCNNYLHTEQFIQFVSETNSIQWRRSILIAVFSLILAIPISGESYLSENWSARRMVTFLFIIFVVCWLILGYNDYHVRQVADLAIQSAMEDSALSFTGENICTIQVTPYIN